MREENVTEEVPQLKCVGVTNNPGALLDPVYKPIALILYHWYLDWGRKAYQQLGTNFRELKEGSCNESFKVLKLDEAKERPGHSERHIIHTAASSFNVRLDGS